MKSMVILPGGLLFMDLPSAQHVMPVTTNVSMVLDRSQMRCPYGAEKIVTLASAESLSL